MTMSLSSRVAATYDAAVVALLNLCPDATPDQAEEVVNAIAALVFTTINAELGEEDVATGNH